jgi:hypothetical protein
LFAKDRVIFCGGMIDVAFNYLCGMKRMFVIRFISLLILIYCNQYIKAQRNDWQKMCLKGKVRSVKLICYEADNKTSEIKKGEILSQYNFIFNEKGYIVEASSNISGWDYNTNDKYKYDDKGNLIEINFIRPNGDTIYKTIYKYDSIANKIEEKNYTPIAKLDHIIKFKYDNEGNCIEDSLYLSNGSLSSYTIFENDKNGNNIKESYYKSNGKPNGKSISEFDKNGNPVANNSYESDGTISSENVYSYEYDKKGSWIKRFNYKGRNKTIDNITEREIIYY